jgi:DNA-binding NarL/FixJ family response regulator
MPAKGVRVMLVDDHEIARGGVRLMLETATDLCVVCEAGSVAQALDGLATYSVDVVIADISMPDKSGVDLLRSIRAQHSHVAVLMLSMHSEKSYAIRALKHGAAGYLTKDVSIAALLAAVRKVAAGGKYFTSALGEMLVTQLQKGRVGHDALSKREMEVLIRLAGGATITTIGESLFLSPKTISTYRARVLEKLGAANNAELTRYAIEEGLIISQ